ncbi:MAG: hypothetical protein R3E97_07060 [Candidatus Eisenbacteria bacterium]
MNRVSMEAFTHPLAVQELASRQDLSAEAVEQFIDDHTFPLVEGTSITFLYRGRADAVYLHQWIYGLPSAQPFHRLGNHDVWYLVQEIPEIMSCLNTSSRSSRGINTGPSRTRSTRRSRATRSVRTRSVTAL